MRLLVILLAAGLFLASVARAAAGGADVELRLELDDAVFVTPEQTRHSPTLIMTVARRHGVWERLWAEAPGFNRGLHPGRVVTGEVSENSAVFDLTLTISADGWIKGGAARYQVELPKTGAESFAGTYRGTFRDKPVRGAARARVIPPAPQVAGRAPIVQFEHPRLLFTRRDLPALRAKLKTPFGQEALTKLTGIIGGAVKCQLFADKPAGLALIPQVEALMADTSLGERGVRGRLLGWRFEQIAIAYDCCYDVWPEEFRARVQAYLRGPQAWRAFTDLGSFSGDINPSPGAPYAPALRYGPALGALAIWGEKGVAPQPPTQRVFLYEQPVPLIPSAKNYQPGELASPFVSHKTPTHWLVAGGYNPVAGKPPLEGLEAAAALRPQVGTPFELAGQKLAFRKLPKLFGGSSILVSDAAERQPGVRMLFYTVIDNDAPRLVQLQTDYAARAWLAGMEFRPGDCAKIEKGFYPLLLATTVGPKAEWGTDALTPRLLEFTPREAAQWVERLRSEHEERRTAWQYDHDQWRLNKGADVEALKLFELSRQLLRLSAWEIAGAGGYESTSLLAMEGLPKYACAYRTALATELSPYPDLAHCLPRKVFTSFYSKEGRAVTADISGPGGYQVRENAENYDVAPVLFGELFPLTSAKWQPTVLWAWQRELGIRTPQDAARALADSPREAPGYIPESLAAWAFVNYPLEMAPAPPAGRLPLTWRADDHGWYGFRNGFRDADDCLLQVYLGRGAAGSEDAGCFRLRALGQTWTTPGLLRPFENVVQFPEDTINAAGRARLVSFVGTDGGSGVISMDLGDVYAAPSRKLYEPLGFIRRADNLERSGITGSRSIAVDYSGASGSPCLVAIADRIVGGRGKVWMWPFRSDVESMSAAALFERDKDLKKPETQDEIRELWNRLKNRGLTPRKRERPGQDADLVAELKPEVAAASIVLHRGDVSLRATLASPAGVGLGLREVEQFRMGPRFTVLRYTAAGLTARSDDAEATFLVIATVQKGAGPEPKAAEDAAVRVGAVTVRLDGDRLMLGK